MNNNRITIDTYTERKLSAEIAELKGQIAKTEIQALGLKEENEQLKKTIEEMKMKNKECGSEVDGNEETA